MIDEVSPKSFRKQFLNSKLLFPINSLLGNKFSKGFYTCKVVYLLKATSLLYDIFINQSPNRLGETLRHRRALYKKIQYV